jgi:hypothetical protein
MKNNFFVSAMLVCLLALGLAFVGCKNSSDPPDYYLSWGAWDGDNYNNVSSQFTSAGNPLSQAGTNAGYLTGSAAQGAYEYVSTNYSFSESKDNIGGSFEEMLNYETNGVGLPEGLKTALKDNKEDMPFAGVFQYIGGAGVGYGVTVFYIRKN